MVNHVTKTMGSVMPSSPERKIGLLHIFFLIVSLKKKRFFRMVIKSIKTRSHEGNICLKPRTGIEFFVTSYEFLNSDLISKRVYMAEENLKVIFERIRF